MCIQTNVNVMCCSAAKEERMKIQSCWKVYKYNLNIIYKSIILNIMYESVKYVLNIMDALQTMKGMLTNI